MLPESLRSALEKFLAAKISRFDTLGGDLNATAQIEANGQRFFVKWNEEAPAGFFSAEADGLGRLRAAGAIRVPAVICVEDTNAKFLVLEWIESTTPGRDFAENLGHGLAALHRITQPNYGLERDNFIGLLPQRNALTSTWPSFYRDHRIRAQVEIARARRRLNPERERLLTRLMDRLDDLLKGVEIAPSLLHGDLWSGNLLAVGDQPVIIDPAVYFGHREVEIAFTELFGGFPRGFLPAYREAYPLDAGYEDRRALYQLYPLLVHLNLFGGSYGAQVDAVCRRYVG